MTALLVLSALYIAIVLFYIVAAWKIYSKAGQPGWGILIPFYNAYLWVKIAGKPGWWLILLFIPLVNIVISFILAIDVAKNFGKSTAFGVLLLAIFSFIGIPMLGFGKAAYAPPTAPAPAPAA